MRDNRFLDKETSQSDSIKISTLLLNQPLNVTTLRDLLRKSDVVACADGGANRLYDAFERDRSLIPPAQYTEVHYEKLAENPVESMQQIYDDLGIADFSEALPGVHAYLDSRQGYQTNRYDLDARTLGRIKSRWASYIDRYGY